MILTKCLYEFKDGVKVQGIKVALAPKVSKFFTLESAYGKDNLMLLKQYDPVLYSWYTDSDLGESVDWNKFAELNYQQDVDN